MTSGASILSLMASGTYLLVVLACLFASATAYQARQLPAHWQTWLILAIVFVVLAAMRFYAVEELLRDNLRAYFRAQGAYGDRRSIQAPLVAMLLAIVALAGFAVLYRWSLILHGRRNGARMVAVVAAIGMLFLMALRLASLHAIDALLYGPLKLNWLIDLGASVTVLAAAVYYVRLVRVRG